MFRTSKVVLLSAFLVTHALADENHKILGARLLPDGSTTSLVHGSNIE